MVSVVQAQNQLQLPPLFGEPDNQIPVIRQNDDPREIVQKYVFVKADLSKKKVFAGEPVLADYKLYTAVNNKAKVLKQPYFSGCSVTEIAEEFSKSQAELNGLHYTVFSIRKVQIIPLQPGTIELGNAYVQNIIPLLHADGSGVENYSITLQNDPVKLEVLPLPAAKKPQDFSNILGDFSIHAAVDTNKAEVGQNINLTVTIKGTGNVAGIQLPHINWPKGIEHFEALDSQKIDQDDFPLSGSKTFIIPFIANKAGAFEIPKISYSYFNTKDNSYETITTAEIPFVVSPVQLQTTVNLVSTEEVSNRKYLWIIAVIALPVLIFLIVAARKKPEKDDPDPASPENGEMKDGPVEDQTFDIITALNELGAATRRNDFLVMAKSFLISVLQEKLNTAETSEIELIGKLRGQAQFAEYYHDCEKIFAVCNENLYALQRDENVSEKVYYCVTLVVKKMYNI